jgi:hypothetical protein
MSLKQFAIALTTVITTAFLAATCAFGMMLYHLLDLLASI